MPIYEYECTTCGCFEQRQPMSKASEALACPTCAMDAQRVFSLPNLYRTTALERTIHTRNEQGSEPRVERVSPSSDGHGGSCAHQHGQHPSTHRPKQHRPWMLGH